MVGMCLVVPEIALYSPHTVYFEIPRVLSPMD